MTELEIDDPCILFALARESMEFRKEFRPNQRFAGAPFWASFCGPEWLSVLVLHTGCGQHRMKSAVDWILGKPSVVGLPYRPKVVLVAGFAGGLRADLKVSDIVLADRVISEQGDIWQTTWPQTRPMESWTPYFHIGDVLSVNRIIGSSHEKRKLAEQTHAIAVDMESAAVARACTAAGVPFGVLRAISDAADTVLSPHLENLLQNGDIHLGRALAAVLRRPKLIGEFRRLGKASQLAAVQLGKALGELLTLTLPWSSELEQ